MGGTLSVEEGIAREALGLLEGAGVVALGAGGITRCMAVMLLRGYRGLTFVTNSVGIAMTLQGNGWERIVLSGGRFRGPAEALIGSQAEATLRALNADVLFLEACGVHPEDGLTASDTAEAETSRCLINAAQNTVVVVDHTKVGVVALAQIAPLSRVDILVTDEGASEEMLQEIELAGVHIIVVDSEASPDGNLSNG